MLRALIVDDDELSREALKDQLEIDYKGTFQRIHLAENAEAARKILRNEKINVVFLDIEMPGENGFDLLNSLQKVEFFIVFTTSYSDYAIKAIRSGAIDYLMKPINRTELKTVIKKMERLLSKNSEPLQVDSGKQSDSVARFYDVYHDLTRDKHALAIPHQGGIRIFQYDEILKIEADGNYSKIFDVKNQSMLSSKTLKYFAVRLQDGKQFYRIHKSALVNVEYIREVQKINHVNYAVMTAGTPLEISRRAHAGLIEKLKFIKKEKK